MIFFFDLLRRDKMVGAKSVDQVSFQHKVLAPDAIQTGVFSFIYIAVVINLFTNSKTPALCLAEVVLIKSLYSIPKFFHALK